MQASVSRSPSEDKSTAMNGVEGDHPEFDNDSIWPRRLLHVPSMTSHAWEPGNSYGGRRNPSYIAISYTWGRYRLHKPEEKPHVRALPIQGVPWAIPRVDPDNHFTTDEFKHVVCETMKAADRRYEFDYIKSLPNNIFNLLVRPILRFLERRIHVYEFLWLDIACIDQRPCASQMAEIGRQARIFQNAKYSYVWLSRLSHDNLDSILAGFNDAVAGLQAEPFDASVAFDIDQRISRATEAIRSLTNDPWFKSLWTLQEGYLCNHAIILSREGRPSPDATKIQVMSATVNHIFKLAYDIVTWSSRTRVPQSDPAMVELLGVIRTTGLAAMFCTNPMGLLAVSSHRNPTNDLDRVYGIMQTLGPNFRVGNAASTNSNHTYSLKDLEEEFGKAILCTYPVLSQMHVHLEKPARGTAWRVQGNSTIPWMVERGDMFGWNLGNRLEINVEITPNALCEMTVCRFENNLWAHFSGKACGFDVLRKAWELADESEFAAKLKRSMWRMHGSDRHSVHIALDQGSFDPLPSGLNIVNIEDPHKLTSWIMSQSQGKRLAVFLLGECMFNGEAFCSGMIMSESEEKGIRCWRRLGICIWLYSHMKDENTTHLLWSLLKGDGKDWEPHSCMFG